MYNGLHRSNCSSMVKYTAMTMYVCYPVFISDFGACHNANVYMAVAHVSIRVAPRPILPRARTPLM